MNTYRKIFFALLITSFSSVSFAQVDEVDEAEETRIFAMEALIAAPPERALPIARKVIEGTGSVELKSRALFVLSQIDSPEAQETLLVAARSGGDPLQVEAIRMIGIGGDPAAMDGLAEIYQAGNEEVRDAVLSAYVIADDHEPVYEIAANTQSPEEFEAAVKILGVMDATEQLRALRNRDGMSEVLINAYAIAGDVETLRELAGDANDPERQAAAIRGLAIAGGDDVSEYLVEIYRDTGSAEVKEAALNAMLIADHDEGVLALYREAQDPAEKRELMRALMVMDSEAVWDVIDATLDESQ